LITELSDHVFWTLVAIYGLLVMASIIVGVMSKIRPETDFSELVARVKTWWVMVAVFTLVMVVNRNVSLVFFAFLSFLALKEYLSLIPTRRADRRVLFWAYLSIPVQYFWVFDQYYGMFIIFVPVYIFLLLPLRMILVGETRGFLKAVGTLHWGLMVTVFSISHLAFLLVLPDAVNPNGGAAALVLFLVGLTQFNDVAQYCWGKAFGRHQVVPTVSPNKTVEGLLGGMITTTVLAVVLAPRLTPFGHREALMAGIILSLGGFVGDIVISAVKRDLDIKDSGDLLPGHGGILDRIDSLTYTAPLFFHFVRYLYLP